jgi:hypothetical protein
MPAFRSVLALLLCASLGMAADLRTLDGKKTSGQVVGLDNKEITLLAGGVAVKTPLAQVLDIIINPAKPLSPEVKRLDVELTDGTVLHCLPDGLSFKGTKAELTLLTGQKVGLELKDLAHYVKDAHDPKIAEMWKEKLKRKVKLDRVVLLRENGKLDALEGTLGEPDAEGKTIKFKDSDGETLNPVFTKIHGLIFYRPEPNTVPTVCQVLDSNGNVLMAQKLTWENGGFVVTTVTGAQLKYDAAGLAKLDYNINKLNFLSDLDPVKVVERSGSGLIHRYRRDHNLDDGAIQVGGKPYPKGLALHAHTELEYSLDSKYKELKALLGVDELVGGDSKAVLIIECDDVKVFEEEVTRKTVKNIAIKVKDVNKLRIIVSSKNVLDLHDHLTLANAQVTQ